MKNIFLKYGLSAVVLGAVGLQGTALAADTYQIDPVHSHVLFKIKHLNVAYQYGRFNKISGTVKVDDKNPAASSVEITVATDSVDTNNTKRDDHLRSPDFFNAKQFPTLSFKSTSVSKAGNAYKVSGNLSLHGKTKPVSFTFNKTGEGKGMQGEYRMGGEATFTIKRSDFGMTYMPPPGLSDEVTLMISFEGIKK